MQRPYPRIKSHSELLGVRVSGVEVRGRRHNSSPNNLPASTQSEKGRSLPVVIRGSGYKWEREERWGRRETDQTASRETLPSSRLSEGAFSGRVNCAFSDAACLLLGESVDKY